MDFSNGIVSLIIIFLGTVIQAILNLFKDEIESKELIKSRFRKYTFASISNVIFWALIFIYLNRNFLDIIPKEANGILLYIFISSFVYLYLNATLSTIVAKKFKIWTPDFKRGSFVLSMIAIQIIFSAITSLLILPFITTGKNYVKEDTVVVIKSESYLLPKNSTFKFKYMRDEPQNKGNSNGINYKFSGSEYELSKNDVIILFEDTELKKLSTKNNNVLYKDGKKYAYANIKSNDDTLVILNSDLEAKLDKTTSVYINNNQNIFTSYAFINIFVINLLMIMYYAIKFFFDWI